MPGGTSGSFVYRIVPGAPVAALPLACTPIEHSADTLLWVHIDGREPEALAWLTEASGLPANVADALDAIETRPRATAMPPGVLVNLRGLGAVRDDPQADDLVSIRLWAEQGRVITLGYNRLAALADVRARIEAGMVRDPGDLIAALADTITERLDPEIALLGDRLDALEDRFARGDAQIRADLGEVRRQSVEYRRFLLPQRDAIARLGATDLAWLAADDRAHIHEAAERAQRMAEELDAVHERARALADQLSDLRQAEANQRNLVLSVVAAIFLPLSFLTGLLGMNVPGIPLAHQPWAFGAVVALCAAIGIAMALWFKRRHWY